MALGMGVLDDVPEAPLRLTDHTLRQVAAGSIARVRRVPRPSS
jgi:hypothetical protein